MYCAARSKLISRYQVYSTSTYENLPKSLKQWNNVLKSEAFQENRRFVVHLLQAILMHKGLKELFDAAETFEELYAGIQSSVSHHNSAICNAVTTTLKTHK